MPALIMEESGLVTAAKPLHNFGRNLTIRPTAYYEPADEGEVLTILERHRGEQIRAVGRLHSWSEAPSGEGVVLNLKHLQQVQLHRANDSLTASVGAGCQIKTLLEHLKQHGATLPSVGLISEQAIAGAISTATHGSGRNSLSHYVEAIRVARYDAATGAAVIEILDSCDAIRAARCSLGCLGIILSVTMRCRERYMIEEHLRDHATLESVLAAESDYPLQQFFFNPWSWTYLAQHRREVSQPRSRLAGLYRLYWFLTIDLGLHLLILAPLRLCHFRILRFLLRHVVPRSVIRGWKVTDDSAAALVMEHELFRHIETELFVTRQHLPAALEYIQKILTVAGRASTEIPDLQLDTTEKALLEALRGQYGHHYPICVRRVLGDDAMISMTSDRNQDSYAISLISYARPQERQGFMQTMEFLTKTMSRRFGARPHWGKFCPLPPEDLVALYPQFAQFQAVCDRADPVGVFRNRWLKQLFSRATN